MKIVFQNKIRGKKLFGKYWYENNFSDENIFKKKNLFDYVFPTLKKKQRKHHILSFHRELTLKPVQSTVLYRDKSERKNNKIKCLIFLKTKIKYIKKTRCKLSRRTRGEDWTVFIYRLQQAKSVNLGIFSLFINSC